MAQTIFVLNGPNLNMLGMREPEKYGRATLADVEKLCRATAKRFGLEVEFRQSNIEGELVDWIQEALTSKAAGLIINPAAYTTTSIAILDALMLRSAGDRNPHHQYSRARNIPAELLCVEGGQGGDGRLRHRGLCAGDRRACRHDWRQGKVRPRTIPISRNRFRIRSCAK